MELIKSVDKQACYTMLLAPFQPVTRIELETHINDNVTCYLDIKNPADRILNVTVTKEPDMKRQITLSSTELEIPGKSNSMIFIKWSPKEVGCWRDILQLTDSRRIKYDIVIATTAKENKKKVQKKSLKKPTSESSILSVPTTKKYSCSDKPQNTQNTNNKPFFINISTQIKQSKPKESISNKTNKENIPSKYVETKIFMSREEDDKNVEVHHYTHHKTTNVLVEQHSNIWNDGNTLPQFLLPSNVPHDIRRATYVKERKHYNNMLNNEEATEDALSHTEGQSECDFSKLIDKIKFTNVIAIPPEIMEKESVEEDSQTTEEAQRTKNQTFDIDCKNVEVSGISVPEINIELPSISTKIKPLEYHESSFKDDVKNLIASSPIIQKQWSDAQEAEHFKYFIDHINNSIQTDYEYYSYTTIPENIETAKETGDIYIEISPPKSKTFARKTIISKNKTICNNNKTMRLQLFVPYTAKKSTKKNIPAIKINRSSLCALRQVKVSSLSFEESSYVAQTEENSFYGAFKPDPFAPSMTENPFLKETMQYNAKWLSEQEMKFTKWLNTLLSTPEDLRVNNVKDTITDAMIKWQSGKDRDRKIGNAISADGAGSADCRTDTKLYVLRKAARIMLRRTEVVKIKSHIDTCINGGVLHIRQDRNLHRDICLQKDIINLFLCYNPLWLRIGLETVYDERIPLRHNNDLSGLTRFLLERFFTDPRLMKMPSYRKADPGKKFLALLNQFMLKKFMFLIYFLDYAKQHKLIGHDPCLFHKRATYKTSREILLHFSRNLLAGIGDVTKVLRAYGYVLTHQQTYIDEYEYDMVDIKQDLRDGVRLCRVIELIVDVSRLTRQCRVPAISRLQKVYNVELALKTLRNVGNVSANDVDAKSIVEGHREKTLSLLWQIVHKVQAPRFNRAAQVIQRWWRSLMWYIRMRNYLYARRNYAATLIQRAWRKRKGWKVENEFTVERIDFLHARSAAICLQTWWRRLRESTRMKELRELKDRRLKATIVLQRKWQATLLMRTQRNWYLHLRNTVLTIQTYWRVKRTLSIWRFERARSRENAVIQIQSWWRSVKDTREKREQFLRWRKSAFIIQRTWKKYQARKRERWDACLKIQTWWSAVSCSRRYKLQKCSCVKLQRWWRDRRHYRMQRQVVSVIETWYLHVKSGRAIRQRFLQMRNATILIQKWWRAILLTHEERRRYLRLRENTIILQKHWRRRILVRQDRQQFLLNKKACITLQSQWRMNRVRRIYKRYKNSVLTVQRKWRAITLSRLVRKEYQDIRIYTIFVQAHWRGSVVRRQFLACRHAAIIIQSYYRMRVIAKWYNQMRNAARTIQFYWRSYKEKKVKNELLLTDVQDKCKDITVQVDQQTISKLPPNLSKEYLEEQIITLRTSHSMGMLITCLSCLDTIVKLAPKICIVLCQLNLVDEIYNTISQRNRSHPWMKACERACSILITLEKYPYTKKCIVKQEYALLLVKLLNDTLKDKETFLSCATLIWYLIQDQDYVKAMMADTNVQWLLKHIQQQFLKNIATTKFQKSKKLFSSCEPDPRTRLFTSMDAAIATIMNRINMLVIRKSSK